MILETGFYTPPPLEGKIATDTFTPSQAPVVYKISGPMRGGFLYTTGAEAENSAVKFSKESVPTLYKNRSSMITITSPNSRRVAQRESLCQTNRPRHGTTYTAPNAPAPINLRERSSHVHLRHGLAIGGPSFGQWRGSQMIYQVSLRVTAHQTRREVRGAGAVPEGTSSEKKQRGGGTQGRGKPTIKPLPQKRFWTPPLMMRFPLPPLLFTPCHFP